MREKSHFVVSHCEITITLELNRYFPSDFIATLEIFFSPHANHVLYSEAQHFLSHPGEVNGIVSEITNIVIPAHNRKPLLSGPLHADKPHVFSVSVENLHNWRKLMFELNKKNIFLHEQVNVFHFLKDNFINLHEMLFSRSRYSLFVKLANSSQLPSDTENKNAACKEKAKQHVT